MTIDQGPGATTDDAQRSPAVRVTGMDHIVLSVRDVERSLRFYVGELGLPGERVEEWRRSEVFFPSVRIDPNTIIDLFALPPVPGDAPSGDEPSTGRGPAAGRNLDHLCLVVEETDLAALAASGRFDVVDGPDRRWGARGDGTSLYVRDPDGNVVELRHYA